MKLKSKYDNPDKMIDYKLDTGDGQFSQSQMPATVAAEIASRSDIVEDSGHEGFELAVDGRMLFPKDIFDLSGSGPEEKTRKSGRPTKAELLEEAGREMTNPQIHQAIEDAKRENAQKRGARE